MNLNAKEIRDLTRMERIGAHSHIRGKSRRKSMIGMACLTVDACRIGFG